MPQLSYNRDEDWLLPPSLGELIPADHAVRFVWEYVAGLDFEALKIEEEAKVEGRPSYPPRVLLGAWIYGFMTRQRTSRKLERGCRENIPLLWLTGQLRPDHSTLARFYKRNRKVVRRLLKHTSEVAVEVGLVDFVLQALDGTRMASVSLDRWQTRAQVEALLAEIEREIAAMEAAQGDEEQGGRRPKRVRLGQEEERERLQRALAELAVEAADHEGQKDAGRVSTSDPEAKVMKGRQGYVAGYNAQAVVDSQTQIVVAAEVTNSASDGAQLLPMLKQVLAMTGRLSGVFVADSGYWAMQAIALLLGAGVEVYVSQPRGKARNDIANPYAKAQFTYDAAHDLYRCPAGQELRFVYYEHEAHGKPLEVAVYQCKGCVGCPGQQGGACTTSKSGRRIKRYPADAQVPGYLEKLRSEEGQQAIRQRKSTVEPVFAMIKEHLGVRRFLLRGLENVRAEWDLTCVAHNLLKLWRYWWQPKVLAARGAVG